MKQQAEGGYCLGRFQAAGDVNRSMRLGELAPLMKMPGVQCFSLQKGDAGSWTDVEAGPAELVDLTTQWEDFTDSAAMLANLDLVITVDTAVAHLAGAIGRPVWVMLAPNADWRWLLDREDSPWDPGMRLFRRRFGEARAAQVERVVAALRERMVGHR